MKTIQYFIYALIAVLTSAFMSCSDDGNLNLTGDIDEENLLINSAKFTTENIGTSKFEFVYGDNNELDTVFYYTANDLSSVKYKLIYGSRIQNVVTVTQWNSESGKEIISYQLHYGANNKIERVERYINMRLNDNIDLTWSGNKVISTSTKGVITSNNNKFEYNSSGNFMLGRPADSEIQITNGYEITTNISESTFSDYTNFYRLLPLEFIATSIIMPDSDLYIELDEYCSNNAPSKLVYTSIVSQYAEDKTTLLSRKETEDSYTYYLYFDGMSGIYPNKVRVEYKKETNRNADVNPRSTLNETRHIEFTYTQKNN